VKLALELPKIQKILKGKEIKGIYYVPDKLVNIITEELKEEV